jgi:hypothetical protein
MARPGVDFCVASEALSEPPPHPGGDLPACRTTFAELERLAAAGFRDAQKAALTQRVMNDRHHLRVIQKLMDPRQFHIHLQSLWILNQIHKNLVEDREGQVAC